MITSSNYHTTVKNIDFKSAPDAIQNMHSKFDLMNKYYGKNDGITEALNVYFEKLNAWASKTPTEKPTKAPKKAALPKGVYMVHGKKVDMRRVKLPSNHPLNILDTESNQFKEALQEYVDAKSKPKAPKPIKAKTAKASKAVKAKSTRLPKPKFKAGDLVKVRLKGWVMVVDKVEEYNKQSKGYRYFIENTTKGTGNGNVGSYWAHELKLYIPMKRKAVKKKVAPRKAAPKVVAPKPVKSSKVRTPELVLIRGFMALNKKSISIKSFETKLAATKHLETVNHKPLIDEIKSKLQAAISAAKDDSNCNGRITATISPDFLKKCKETLANAKELLRVSYIGGVSKKKFVRKPSRVDDLLLLDEIKGRASKKKAIKKKRK